MRRGARSLAAAAVAAAPPPLYHHRRPPPLCAPAGILKLSPTSSSSGLSGGAKELVGLGFAFFKYGGLAAAQNMLGGLGGGGGATSKVSSSFSSSYSSGATASYNRVG